MEAVYKNSKNATFSPAFHASPNCMLYTCPFLNHSYSSSSSFSSSSPLPHPNCRDSQQNQPPLLPLPNSRPRQNNRRKINNQQSLSVRKSSVSSGGRERFKHQSASSNNRLGPDPMDVPKLLLFSSSSAITKNDQVTKTKFSGCVVSTVLSPPPSSLPLPTFSLCCNAAAGIDARATDSLRRILGIR